MNICPETWCTIASFWFLIICTSCVVTSLQIIVQFDGSLRPPSDFGFPTSTLGKMAACACTISTVTAHSDTTCLLRIGGKGLDATTTTTSGEVEYEGLIFALKSLRKYLEETNYNAAEKSNLSVTVSGDCKTVIDQISKKSNARKLERFYLRALEEVNALSNQRSPIRKLQFRHTPRSNNVICDMLSASIILHDQKKVFGAVCSELLMAEDPSCISMDLTDTLNKWFQHQESLVPLTRRPPLYRFMAEIEIKKKNYLGLLEIGNRYEADVRTLESNWLKAKQHHGIGTDTLGASTHTASKAEAISYQIFSLYALGRNRPALRLQAKNRVLLKGFSSILVDIEKQHRGEEDLPKSAAMVALTNEMNNIDRILFHNRTGWPIPVQHWCDEMIQSQSWEEHRELLSMPKQLMT